MPTLRAAACRHWPLAVVLMLASALILTQLGRDYLWGDEGDTAVLGRNILRHGLPVAWDGVTFAAPDYGQRLRFGFVMVSHPWLQYYMAAASFALFGESAWAARLPFALAGLATVALVYAMAAGLLRNRAVATISALLLTLSVQFLLYARQARNYPLHALLTCALVWQFHRLRSRTSSAVFAGIGILLFHTHPIGLAAVLGLGLLTSLPSHAHLRGRFWPAAAVIAAYATPWVLLSWSGLETATSPAGSAGALVAQAVQFGIEFASVTPVLGVGAGLALLWLRRSVLQPAERNLLLSVLAVSAAEAVVMAATHDTEDLWVLGLHHTPGLLPLTMLLAGMVITRLCRGSRVALVSLVLLFGFTRAAQLSPWAWWAEPGMPAETADRRLLWHIPERMTDRWLRTGQLQHVRSLFEPNPGVIQRITEFLDSHASAGDVVITNYEWEALYFHTGLPQGARVSPSFPIYTVARAQRLPEYVFGADRVRWIVWRPAWPAYFPEQDARRLLRELTAAGVTTELAASIPETLFENRENVHFRRYAGNRYVFPWYAPLPSVQIFRVDWESSVERHRQQADELFEAAQYDKAIEHYTAYLAARPQDGGAWSRLGIARIATGSLAGAIEAFRGGVRSSPDDAFAHRNLAHALMENGNAAEAADHARQALALNPDDADARDLLTRAVAGASF